MTLSEYLMEAVASRRVGKYSYSFNDLDEFIMHLEKSKYGIPFSKLDNETRDNLLSNLTNQRYVEMGRLMPALVGYTGKFYYLVDERWQTVHVFCADCVYVFSYYRGHMSSVSRTPYSFNWTFLKRVYTYKDIEKDIRGAEEFVQEINRVVV